MLLKTTRWALTRWDLLLFIPYIASLAVSAGRWLPEDVLSLQAVLSVNIAY